VLFRSDTLLGVHFTKHGQHVLQIIVIQIEYLRVLGVFLEWYGEGVGGVDFTSGGRAQEDANGSFACPSCNAVVVIGG